MNKVEKNSNKKIIIIIVSILLIGLCIFLICNKLLNNQNKTPNNYNNQNVINKNNNEKRKETNDNIQKENESNNEVKDDKKETTIKVDLNTIEDFNNYNFIYDNEYVVNIKENDIKVELNIGRFYHNIYVNQKHINKKESYYLFNNKIYKYNNDIIFATTDGGLTVSEILLYNTEGDELYRLSEINNNGYKYHKVNNNEIILSQTYILNSTLPGQGDIVADSLSEYCSNDYNVAKVYYKIINNNGYEYKQTNIDCEKR